MHRRTSPVSQRLSVKGYPDPMSFASFTRIFIVSLARERDQILRLTVGLTVESDGILRIHDGSVIFSFFFCKRNSGRVPMFPMSIPVYDRGFKIYDFSR